MNSLNKRKSTPIENSTIEAQTGHHMIHTFTDEPLTEDELTTLYEIARHTISSSFLQQTTITRVTGPIIHERLHTVSEQSYVGDTRGELLAFAAGRYRNSRIREEGGADSAPLHRTNLLLTALHDTLLVTQNAVVATEPTGLNICYFDSIHADPHAVTEILSLPKFTFLVLGLFVGHPDQEPQFEPHLSLSIIIVENSCPKVGPYSELTADYDETIADYYNMRSTSKRAESFSTLVHTTIGVAGAHVSPILEVLDEQGFASE